MPYRKRTLRQMPPKTRKLAKLLGEMESVTRRLKAQIPIFQDLEMWERAEAKRQLAFGKGKQEKNQ